LIYPAGKIVWFLAKSIPHCLCFCLPSPVEGFWATFVENYQYGYDDFVGVCEELCPALGYLRLWDIINSVLPSISGTPTLQELPCFLCCLPFNMLFSMCGGCLAGCLYLP